MSLDYRTSTYRPYRPDTRNMTSYGCMSTWIPRQKQLSHFSKSRRSMGENVYPFEERRPIILPAPLGMPTMHDTYIGKHVSFTPYQSNAGLDRWSTGGPGHGYLPLDPSSRHGGNWRHVKEVMQAEGRRLVFVDGQVAVNETLQQGGSDQVDGGELRLPRTDVSQRVSSRKDVRRPKDGGVGVTQKREPIARYDMIDVKKAVEKDNWNILR